MTRENEIIAGQVAERKALWAPSRRAEPMQDVRRIMRKKEILNKDLAIRLGVTEAAVSRLIKGSQNIQIDTLYMLADALEESLTINIGSDSSEYTYAFDDADSNCVEYDSVFSEEESNVVQLNCYRKSTAPKYNSFELECA